MPGRAMFGSLGTAIGRMLRYEGIMAAVALHSVECVHGLQLGLLRNKTKLQPNLVEVELWLSLPIFTVH